MLSNITWAEYWTGIGITTVVYYLYIALRYYPNELKKILSGRKGESDNDTAAVGVFIQQDVEDDEDEFQDGGEDEFQEIEALIESLTSTIEKASKEQLVLPEFKQCLRMALREYPGVKDSPFRNAVSELIVSECEKQGTYTLSEKDIDVLWNDV